MEVIGPFLDIFSIETYCDWEIPDEETPMFEGPKPRVSAGWHDPGHDCGTWQGRSVLHGWHDGVPWNGFILIFGGV